MEAVEARLREAIEEGLVVRAASGFTFLHDRMKQAAYATLPEESRSALHLAVGRLLPERWDPVSEEERVFDVVGHLNVGRDLIADEEERLAVARLNLTAGRRAKSSAAYREALDHFRIGADLLPETGWTAHYDLAFDLHREAAECEYLGTVKVGGLPSRPRGEERVSVEFAVGGEGILAVTARDLATGRVTEARLATVDTPASLRQKLGLPAVPTAPKGARPIDAAARPGAAPAKKGLFGRLFGKK